MYQTEAVSTGSPEGKKHGLLYRLTPLLPFYSLSLSPLFYPQPSTLSISGHVIQSRVCVKGITRRGYRGDTKGRKGGEEGHSS